MMLDSPLKDSQWGTLASLLFQRLFISLPDHSSPLPPTAENPTCHLLMASAFSLFHFQLLCPRHTDVSRGDIASPGRGDTRLALLDRRSTHESVWPINRHGTLRRTTVHTHHCFIALCAYDDPNNCFTSSQGEVEVEVEVGVGRVELNSLQPVLHVRNRWDEQRLQCNNYNIVPKKICPTRKIVP